jgi:hypothetical protein
MDFSRHIMKAEFAGFQQKRVCRLKWCLMVFMGLGSLSLLYAFLSSFVILLAYVMLLKTFAFDKGFFEVFLFTLNR